MGVNAVTSDFLEGTVTNTHKIKSKTVEEERPSRCCTLHLHHMNEDRLDCVLVGSYGGLWKKIRIWIWLRCKATGFRGNERRMSYPTYLKVNCIYTRYAFTPRMVLCINLREQLTYPPSKASKVYT